MNTLGKFITFSCLFPLILFSCSENSFAEIDIQSTEDASVKLALEKELSKIPTSTPKPTSTPIPTPKPTSTPIPTTEPTSTPEPDLITDFKISATDLLSEFGTTSEPGKIDFYKRSEANAKYLNKVLEVTGRITMLSYNDFNYQSDIKIDVGIGDNTIYFKQVFCELDNNVLENIDELEVRQEITLQGIYKEDTFFYINLISCKRIKDRTDNEK